MVAPRTVKPSGGAMADVLEAVRTVAAELGRTPAEVSLVHG